MTDLDTHNITIPNSMLKGYGCINCIWKSYGQCPHNVQDNEVHMFKSDETEIGCVNTHCNIPSNKRIPKASSNVVGYCPEFANFLLSIAEKEDSISAVKEKFMLYTQEMEAMADHMKFKELQDKYRIAKEEGKIDSECAELIVGIQLYKSWWSRLTDSVVKGLGRIADRERRSKDVHSTQKISVQQLNVLLKESDEVLKRLK